MAIYKVECKVSEDGTSLGGLKLESTSNNFHALAGKEVVGELVAYYPRPVYSPLEKFKGRVVEYVTEGVLTIWNQDFDLSWRSNAPMPKGFLEVKPEASEACANPCENPGCNGPAYC